MRGLQEAVSEDDVQFDQAPLPSVWRDILQRLLQLAHSPQHRIDRIK
jgi:hypothetical protein